MKPPLLLLLLLLLVGLVSCIAREEIEGRDAEDNLGDTGASLSEDADPRMSKQRYPDEEDDIGYKNVLKEFTPDQIEREKQGESSRMLFRSVRRFGQRSRPTGDRSGYPSGYGVRGSSRKKAGVYKPDDDDDFQQDGDEYDEEEDNESGKEEYYTEDEDGSDVEENDFDEEEEDEDEEDYQSIRRPLPKRLRGKSRRKNKGQWGSRSRGRSRRDLEDHEDMKRGTGSKLLRSKFRNIPKYTLMPNNDSGSEYSDSDDDDETRAFLRSHRKNKTAITLQKLSKYNGGQTFNKRGIWAKFKGMFKKKRPSSSKRPQNNRDGADYDNSGYDDSDEEIYDGYKNRYNDFDEDSYEDYGSDKKLLMSGRKKGGFLSSFKRRRNKRGNLRTLW